MGSARLLIGIALAGVAAVMVAQGASAGTILDTGLVRIGINDLGNLITCPGSISCPWWDDALQVGLEYVPTGADSIDASCDCEGWGLAYDGTVSGYANKDKTPPSAGIVYGSFVDSPTTAVSVMNVGDYRITHDFHTVSWTTNLIEVDVTIENIGSVSHSDTLYRRIMDWEVEPTAFNEYVTIDGITPIPSALLQFVDDGHSSNDPLQPICCSAPGFILGPPYFIDRGPMNNGAAVDFNFGTLLPGGKRTFTIYYGATANESHALSLVSAVIADVWSLGQPATDPIMGTPNTFIWAFSGLRPGPSADFAFLGTWRGAMPCHDEFVILTDLSRAGHPRYPIETSLWTIDGVVYGPYLWPRSPAPLRFAAPGTYSVTLNITDVRGLQAEVTKDIFICNDAHNIIVGTRPSSSPPSSATATATRCRRR
jgi:hypothetical protein